MALIECKDCGNKISDKATICPSCGSPVQIKEKIGIDLFFVLSLIGGILFAVSPFFPYVAVNMSFLGLNTTDIWNMIEVSEEAGDRNIVTVPTIILILGWVLIVLTVLTLWKKISLLTIIFSGVAIVVAIIFEVFVFQKGYVSPNEMFAKAVMEEFDEFKNLFSYTRQIGFYAMILGPVLCMISNIIKNKVKR